MIKAITLQPKCLTLMVALPQDEKDLFNSTRLILFSRNTDIEIKLYGKNVFTYMKAVILLN